MYLISYNTIGKSDFKITDHSKHWNDTDSYRTFIKFYENGNVNFFYLKEIDDNSFDPDYTGDRGFYYFLDNQSFIIKIYVQTDEWGGKSYETYRGKIDGDKILLRTNHNLAGTNDYIIEVFKKSDFQAKKIYNTNW